MKVKCISVYHYCQGQGAEYKVQFKRGKEFADTPKYKTPTKSSLRRLAKLFFDLECMLPSFQSNFIHLQAYTKGD